MLGWELLLCPRIAPFDRTIGQLCRFNLLPSTLLPLEPQPLAPASLCCLPASHPLTMLAITSWKPCSLAGAAAWEQKQHWRRRREHQAERCRASAAEADPPVASSYQEEQQQQQAQDSGSSETYEFTYQGSDGRLKATFEQAFKNRAGGNGGSSSVGETSVRGGVQAPWALSYQMSER